MTFDATIECIAKALDPEKIILFGSRARGEARFDSDADLLVIVPYEGDVAELSVKAYRAARGRDTAMDILVYPRAFFDAEIRDGSVFLQQVLAEGQIVYVQRNTQMV
jgi:uncharacterized protein